MHGQQLVLDDELWKLPDDTTDVTDQLNPGTLTDQQAVTSCQRNHDMATIRIGMVALSSNSTVNNTSKFVSAMENPE